MRLGKRERLVRRVEALEDHARLARVAKVSVLGEVSIPSSLRNMWPVGRPTVNWAWNGLNARRINRC